MIGDSVRTSYYTIIGTIFQQYFCVSPNFKWLVIWWKDKPVLKKSCKKSSFKAKNTGANNNNNKCTYIILVI